MAKGSPQGSEDVEGEGMTQEELKNKLESLPPERLVAFVNFVRTEAKDEGYKQGFVEACATLDRRISGQHVMNYVVPAIIGFAIGLLSYYWTR